MIRYTILVLLASMAFILYLDRVCIGQAAPSIQEELKLSDKQMGLIFGAFTIAYGIFEIPTGHWGDRFGSRGVITRIVIWWSAFTSLTGFAWNMSSMVAVRFLFGAGEAGALPNTARVLRLWFPDKARGKAQGIIATSMMVGGTLAPIVTLQLIDGFGWRMTFVILGALGVVWSSLFYWYFRDNPQDHAGTNAAERNLILAGRTVSGKADEHLSIPWKLVLTCPNVWLMGGIMTCSAGVYYAIFSWYPTYLQKGWGVDKHVSANLTSLVLAGGAVGSLAGGFVVDQLVRHFTNERWNRTLFTCAMLLTGAGSLAYGLNSDSPYVMSACTSFTNVCLQLTVPTWWNVVTHISGHHVGAMFGMMNMLGIPGAFGSQYFLGVLSEHYQNQGLSGREQWDPGMSIFIVVLTVDAILWLFVDPRRKIVPDDHATSPDDEETALPLDEY